MEAAAVPTDLTDQAQAVHDNSDPAAATEAQLFHFSTWVHVGPGADSCDGVDEEKGEVTCQNALHFHAWCRMPNQFQHQELRNKAFAAKARHIRTLRDPESDAHVILEDELDRLERAGESIRESLVDELADKDAYQDTLTAIQEVQAQEEDDQGTKRFEHIDDDQRRALELEMMPASERPDDEYQELLRHLEAYNQALEEKIAELRAPVEESLRALSLTELLERVRDDRIELNGNKKFTETYNVWEWFTCTLTQPGGGRVWSDMEDMRSAAEEVIKEIEGTFGDLERDHQAGPGGSGN